MSNKQHKLAQEVLGDAISGAYLGLFCAAAVMLLDVARVRETLAMAQSPTFEFMILLASLSLAFAIGMAITGIAIRTGANRQTK